MSAPVPVGAGLAQQLFYRLNHKSMVLDRRGMLSEVNDSSPRGFAFHLNVCKYSTHVCLGQGQKTESDHLVLKLQVVGCKSPCGYCMLGIDPGPLQGQEVLLIVEASFQLLNNLS